MRKSHFSWKDHFNRIPYHTTILRNSLRIFLKELLTFIAMAGIYIHIPYCRKACHYCNFTFTTDMRTMPEVMKALADELVSEASYLREEKIESIYFGGGTPSLLRAKDIRQFLDLAATHYSLGSKMEVTLEANPEDVTLEKVKGWMEAGINRFSLGVQSFSEADLRYLSRRHQSGQAEFALNTLVAAKAKEISLDFIYGMPSLSLAAWKHHLKKVIDYNIPHFSAYGLTVEANTPLWHSLRRGEKAAIDDDQMVEQFHEVMSFAKQHGYEHYEISNFAKAGHRAIHNTNYWRSQPYLGIGPGAHSFNGRSRRWNTSHIRAYLKGRKQLVTEEVLTLEAAYHDYLLTRLRTCEGFMVEELYLHFGKEYGDYFTRRVQPWMERSMVSWNTIRHEAPSKTHVYLTEKGRYYADAIISDLFRLHATEGASHRG